MYLQRITNKQIFVVNTCKMRGAHLLKNRYLNIFEHRSRFHLKYFFGTVFTNFLLGQTQSYDSKMLLYVGIP